MSDDDKIREWRIERFQVAIELSRCPDETVFSPSSGIPVFAAHYLLKFDSINFT